MCCNPRTIPNPHYKYLKAHHYRHTDDVSPTITVPCGTCKECQSLKSQYLAQRLEMESLTHYIYYFTFTCSDEYIVSENLNGHYIARYPYEVIQKCIKRFRINELQNPNCPLFGRDFKYMFVSEYGGIKHRPHLHGFFLIGKSDDPERDYNLLRFHKYLYQYWKTHLLENVGSDSHPIYKEIYHYAEKWHNGVFMRNYDLQSVHVNGDNNLGSCYYINKYLFKRSEYVKHVWNVIHDYHNNPPKGTLSYTEFVKHWNKYKPCIRKSRFFGFPDGYVNYDVVNNMLERSLSAGLKYPAFISPYSGTSRPLSPYYKQYASPSLLDKFTESEYNSSGFVTSAPILPHSEPSYNVNLFDYTDIFF